MESQQANVDIIRRTYEGPEFLLEALTDSTVWTEAEGYPYGGTFHGAASIKSNVFDRLGTEWDNFVATVHTYHEVSSQKIVITEGVYTGTYKATGKSIRADFAHVWRLADGKIAAFKQYVDSHIVVQAMS
ncbi:nuclear transport factor 2 family protein [Paenibacillus alvei]|uniref:Nuclear transport factor 2 family protein n=1 Tax=Paenibacillus alvei TaxID=44250 RepID=A0ABT4GYH9_PAEAL|nr:MULTISPECIES: nuclear transport factor 2 family protein [Paenibacillus]EJW16110.1 ketosteroid isomerase-like protein [Paenibacillus alvei DSM 29]MCY7482924.1 nuclear transport factor 2 family protein [Paenibacillus alvei]MCY9541196.1 nuclear transport factor 2 family protein [Paenibacillus alvei]MCY9704549.1 nuclear transport factor 2 family protein [Paenibacillus alvei]MCY9732791.1 nuclear transport factor 2 family protein [Paenibacillus alvei]